MLWVGVDVEKVSSTAHNQALGILAGIDGLGVKPSEISRIVHGSTVATNIALERNGARVVFITTRGFRDVLEIGRGERIKMYDARSGRDAPLVPRSSVIEVNERMGADGNVVEPLSLAAIDKLMSEKVVDPEAIAVCFLHAYRNPAHERMLAEHLRSRFPAAFVTSSTDVLAEPKEYERAATTVLNAYVAPRMRSYLFSLKAQLNENGYRGPLDIMTSNGGTASVDRMTTLPVATIMSGPAAGVTGACHWAAESGLGDIITFDMGGTSTDTCLIKDNTVSLTGETAISGLISRLPQIAISSVGAGGGSIAQLVSGGVSYYRARVRRFHTRTRLLWARR